MPPLTLQARTLRCKWICDSPLTDRYGNLNAPTAILYSGVIYVLRSLLSVNIPLNHGCLRPINVVLPSGTILSPSETAATVG